MSVSDPSRGQGAQRWASILVGAAVLVLVGWMTYEAAGAQPTPRRTPDAGATAALPEAPEAGAATPEDDGLDAGLSLAPLSLGDAAALPSGAPRQVKLGVVVVSFAGAEGAPPSARPKAEARALADRLAGEARADFHHAVSGGDPGSSDDIGRLPRGILDPGTEVAVFALAPGEVSTVLETPRGYWIVKRVE